MAFTEAEKLSICKILGINSIALDAKLDYYSAYITAEVETAVRTELTRWTTGGIGDDFVSIRPMTTNRGVLLDAENAKRDVRQNIARMLFFDDSEYGTSSDDQIEVVRG